MRYVLLADGRELEFEVALPLGDGWLHARGPGDAWFGPGEWSGCSDGLVLAMAGRQKPGVQLRAIPGGTAVPDGWPEPLSDAPYRGPIGEYVQMIEEESEADPAATLVAYGNALGRGPHIMVEEDRHGTNLFAIVVGQSGRARKGVSWNRAYRIVADSDTEWAIKNQGEGGLSTGEGLVMAVKDKSERSRAVTDKRLLVVMDELGEMLTRMKRDNNTLGSVVRLAWDGKKLAIRTKVEPLQATGAHVSIIGHITVPELENELTEKDIYNGFGNRFLWRWRGGSVSCRSVGALTRSLRSTRS